MIDLDLGDDKVLRFGAMTFNSSVRPENSLPSTVTRAQQSQLAGAPGRQAKAIGMPEAGLLGHAAVKNERRRLIVRFIAVGEHIEIPPQCRQVRRRRVLDVANLDDVVDAFADIDLAGACLDRDIGIVGGPRLRGQQDNESQRRPAWMGIVASPILLHGNSAQHAGLHFAVALAFFLLPFADLAQGVFDLIARDLRLLLLLLLFVGLA